MLNSPAKKSRRGIPAAAEHPDSQSPTNSVSRIGAPSANHKALSGADATTASPEGVSSIVKGDATKVGPKVTQEASLSTATTRPPDELVVRAQRGDRVAFTTLFRRHRSAVAAIAYRMLGPNADLEDVIQEVFLQVHRSLPHFRAQAKFSTWLHRVAVNVVLMTRRRAKSRPAYTFEDTPRHEPDLGPLPDQHLDRLRRQRAFHRLLDKLSEKKRTVFVLHEIEGMRPVDIAKQVGCPVLTVRTRLFYARRELCELMKHEPALSALPMVADAAGAPTRKKAARRGNGATKASRKGSDKDLGDDNAAHAATPPRLEGDNP